MMKIGHLVAENCGMAMFVGRGGKVQVGKLEVKNTTFGIHAHNGGSVEVEKYRFEDTHIAVISDQHSQVTLGTKPEDEKQALRNKGLKKYIRGWTPPNG